MRNEMYNFVISLYKWHGKINGHGILPRRALNNTIILISL